MASNKKKKEDLPAISINTSRGVTYCKTIDFTEGCKLIQDADNAICSGATIWMEAKLETLIIDGKPYSKING